MVDEMVEDASYSTVEQLTPGRNPNTQNMGGNDQYDSLHKY